MSLLSQCILDFQKMRRYPGHHLNCYIHIDSQICDCGTEEAEQELLDEETKAETQDNDSAEREHYDI